MPRTVIRRSKEFSKRKGSKGRAYYIDKIPGPFWDAARLKARRERRSMRIVILTLVKRWMEEDEQNGHAARMADGAGGSEVRPGRSADDLCPGERGEAASGPDYGVAPAEVPQGMDRSVAGQKQQAAALPDAGVGAGDADDSHDIGHADHRRSGQDSSGGTANGAGVLPAGRSEVFQAGEKDAPIQGRVGR